MDCEQFDRAVLDFLYDELEELTRADAQRHLGQCQRCRGLTQGLDATLQVSRLPILEPPAGFEARVSELERAAHRELSLRQRLVRGFTIASGYATRPQIAMAALLFLMLGSSLVLLRPRPGAHASVSVTERGVPRPESETIVVALPAPGSFPAAALPLARSRSLANPSPLAVVRTSPADGAHARPASSDVETEMDIATRKAEDRAYAEAMTAFQQRRFQEAQDQFDAIVEARGSNAAAAELYAALALEASSGCAAAIPRFDSVAAHNPNKDLGALSIWRSATCRGQLGHVRRATLDLQKLSTVPAYAARAKQALIRLATEEASEKRGLRPPENPDGLGALRADAPIAPSSIVLPVPVPVDPLPPTVSPVSPAE